MPARQGLSDIIFAVWKKQSDCKEPWEYATVMADLIALQPIREAACTVLNATDGMP
jgi:hypothetical protein